MNTSTDVVFKDQSANNLVYCLYKGLIDVTDLTIITEKTVQVSGITIRLGIIGASHFMQITDSNTLSLTEVFACKQPSCEKQKPYLQFPLQDCLQKQFLQMKNPMMRYETYIDTLDWDVGLEKLIADRSCDWLIKLVYDFPGYEHATTALFLSEEDVGLTLITYHCYPNEKIIVKTKTTLQK